jgi:outer membrane protein assembly factor BamB
MGKWQEVLEKLDKNKDGELALDEVPEDVTFKWRKNVPDGMLGNELPYRWVLFTLFHPAQTNVFTRDDWKQVEEFVKKNPNSLVAIKPGGRGNISTTHVSWKATRGIPDMPSPLWYRGRVYLMMDGGMLTSYDAKTSKLLLDRERIGVTSQFMASPVAAGGNIYVASLPGKIAVVKAADTLEVASVNDLKEQITATPAVLDGKLYVRTANHLAAFGK